MLNFEVTRRSYAIEIEEERFLDLLDSESYVTDNAALKSGSQTLCEKLGQLDGVDDVNYDGHFGSYIYLMIDDEDDTDDLKKKINDVIEEHLKWCSSLKKAWHVLKRREEV